MTREQLIKSLRCDSSVVEDAGFLGTAERLNEAADMLEADGVPVAYRHLHEDGWEYYDAPTGDDCECCLPLYTAPQPAIQERKPLKDEQITEHFRERVDTGSLLSFADGVRFAEMAHGIGVQK